MAAASTAMKQEMLDAVANTRGTLEAGAIIELKERLYAVESRNGDLEKRLEAATKDVSYSKLSFFPTWIKSHNQAIAARDDQAELAHATDLARTEAAFQITSLRQQLENEQLIREKAEHKIAEMQQEVRAEREGRMHAQVVANERAAHAHLSEVSL